MYVKYVFIRDYIYLEGTDIRDYIPLEGTDIRDYIYLEGTDIRDYIYLEETDSFGVVSRFTQYSINVYCTVCSSCFKFGPVLEMNLSLQ